MAASETPMAATPAKAAASNAARVRAMDFIVKRHNFRWWEALPWLLIIAAYFIFPDRMTFGTQVLIGIHSAAAPATPRTMKRPAASRASRRARLADSRSATERSSAWAPSGGLMPASRPMSSGAERGGVPARLRI